MNLMRLMRYLWCTFVNRILPCQSLIFQQDTFAKLQSPKLLLAIVLEEKEEDSASRCLVECYIHAQCTGVKVQRQNNTWNCSLVTTDVTMVNERSLPFENETSNFDFYYVLETANRGQVGCVQRSPGYRTWGSGPWTTRDDYLNNGRLTGIKVWFGVRVPGANFIHGIQVRFGEVWSTVKGTGYGHVGELSLSDNETISHVRYWVTIEKTYGIEFRTSEGAVYGPWGATCCDEKTVQMKELLWISGGTSNMWTSHGTFKVIRPITFFFTRN